MVMLILLISPCMDVLSSLNVSYIEIEDVSGNGGADGSNEFSSIISGFEQAGHCVQVGSILVVSHSIEHDHVTSSLN